jgi:hypothetical protein
VCLEQDRGAEEAVAIPPVAGTAGRTAESGPPACSALPDSEGDPVTGYAEKVVVNGVPDENNVFDAILKLKQ